MGLKGLILKSIKETIKMLAQFSQKLLIIFLLFKSNKLNESGYNISDFMIYYLFFDIIKL